MLCVSVQTVEADTLHSPTTLTALEPPEPPKTASKRKKTQPKAPKASKRKKTELKTPMASKRKTKPKATSKPIKTTRAARAKAVREQAK